MLLRLALVYILFTVFYVNGYKAIFSIKPLLLLKVYDGTCKFPKVPGAFHCGGPAKFVELRQSGCLDGPKACKISRKEGLTAEMDFIPVRDMDSLDLKIEMAIDNGELGTVEEMPIPNSAVKKGTKYTLSVTAPLHSELNDVKLRVRFLINDQADKSLRLCVEAEIYVT